MIDRKKYKAVRDLINTGRMVTLGLYRKDGTFRVMNCRTGVTRHLKGGSASYDAESKGHIRVYDVQAEGYRTVNTATVVWIKCDGKEINFE